MPGSPASRPARHLAAALALSLALGLSASAQTPPAPPAAGAPADMSAPGAAPGPEPGAAPGPEPAYSLPSMAPLAPEKIAIDNAAEIAAWARSGHANAASESFAHWNPDGEIPGVCATCHSGAGFRALYGLDGGQPGIPQQPIPTGGVVDCATCHNPRLSAINEIALPTGKMHPVSGGEASCLTCHQGRASGAGVDRAITEAGGGGGGGDDAPNPKIRFVNPHYAVAAATWLGGYGGLGYHYPGKEYDGRFTHAKPVATCAACHDPHSLKVSEQTCLTCHHSGDARAIRITRQSHDGSGDLKKGIHADIAANAAALMALVGDYAADVAGKAMVHDGHRHPYFFADGNGDGIADQADGKPVPYDAWTPRLLRAAYNWKFVTADTGAHVHNPHYALQLLYDSIEDLSGALGQDMAARGLVR